MLSVLHSQLHWQVDRPHADAARGPLTALSCKADTVLYQSSGRGTTSAVCCSDGADAHAEATWRPQPAGQPAERRWVYGWLPTRHDCRQAMHHSGQLATMHTCWQLTPPLIRRPDQLRRVCLHRWLSPARPSAQAPRALPRCGGPERRGLPAHSKLAGRCGQPSWSTRCSSTTSAWRPQVSCLPGTAVCVCVCVI